MCVKAINRRGLLEREAKDGASDEKAFSSPSVGGVQRGKRQVDAKRTSLLQQETRLPWSPYIPGADGCNWSQMGRDRDFGGGG